MKGQPKTEKMSVPKELALVIFLLLLVIIGLLIFKPYSPSFIIYSGEKYTWDFSQTAEYSFNSSVLNVSDKSVSLKLQENITSTTSTAYVDTSLSSATYDGENVLSKLNAIDSAKQEVRANKAFEITFADAVNSGDVIGIYMTTSKESGTIYLCAQNTDCSSPGYGSATYDAKAGWYNLTLSSMSGSANSFRIRTTGKFKFDYIKATYKKTTTKTTTTYYYPSSATIETPELSIENLSKWEMFGVSAVSNGQTLSYAHSTDSGQSWKSVIPGDDLSASADNSTKKIKFRATLGSDGDTTPTLYWMSMSYETSYNPPCVENWSCAEWNECAENGTQSRTCTDQNVCGTEENKPTIQQNCVYTPPCVEDWSCTEWSTCTENGTKTRTCTDSNVCGTTQSKPTETDSCIYIPPEQNQTQACTESWSCTDWSACTENNLQTRTCTDSNVCGTTQNKSATQQSCTYVPPQQNFTLTVTTSSGGTVSATGLFCSGTTCAGIYANGTSVALTATPANNSKFSNWSGACTGNSSTCTVTMDSAKAVTATFAQIPPQLPVCTENWVCSQWSFCSENGTQSRLCSDLNSCGTAVNRPALEQSCIYVPPQFNFSLNQTNKTISIEANRTFIVNASAAQGMDLEFFAKENLYNTSLSIQKYDNVSVSIANVTDKPAKFQEINATSDLNAKIEWAIIKIYYTDEEMTEKKLNKSTLKIYFYNETAGNWGVIESYVNATGKYVWANVTHFSLYGVFGEQVPSAPAAPQSGGGGGGGGGGGDTKGLGGTPPTAATPSATQTPQAEKQQEKKAAPSTTQAAEEPGQAAPIEEGQEAAATTPSAEENMPLEGPATSAFAILVATLKKRYEFLIIGATAAIGAAVLFIKYRRIKAKERAPQSSEEHQQGK